jgi:hypothetical protein
MVRVRLPLLVLRTAIRAGDSKSPCKLELTTIPLHVLFARNQPDIGISTRSPLKQRSPSLSLETKGFAGTVPARSNGIVRGSTLSESKMSDTCHRPFRRPPALQLNLLGSVPMPTKWICCEESPIFSCNCLVRGAPRAERTSSSAAVKSIRSTRHTVCSQRGQP